MYNSEENKMIGSCTGKGALVGAILCGILFLWSILGGVWNSMCSCLGTKSCTLPTANNFLIYLFAFIIPLLIGLLVGFAQASSAKNARMEKEKAEQDRNDMYQRQDNAKKLKQRTQILLQEMRNTRESVKNASEQPPLSSNGKQRKVWETLNDAFNANTELMYQANMLNVEERQ